ncbi:DUF2237 family protein [Balneola sp. MJW-20]|uniref:DUF2237 family protein n=1 Tax=Gracilimonas aurantiaca TaxID=3234185 RepID=UPI003467D46A
MKQKNVTDTELELCSLDPITGNYRDGYCRTGPHDHGKHVVAARMTREFLEFSRSRGNDLISPAPLYGFPGLKAGDWWCLCIDRWMEAEKAGVAPPVNLKATNQKALETASADLLKKYSINDYGTG